MLLVWNVSAVVAAAAAFAVADVMKLLSACACCAGGGEDYLNWIERDGKFCRLELVASMPASLLHWQL